MINELYKIKKHMNDLQIKEIVFGRNKLYLINIETVSSSSLSNQYIMDYLSRMSLLKKDFTNIKSNLINYIPSINFSSIKKEELFNYLFNGFTALIYKKDIFVFETKSVLDRGVNSPTSEPTIKGPKDSFNENYNTNIGLIRKRIKDINLYMDEFTLGKKTNTKVCIMYMNDIVDKNLLKSVNEKIKNINSNEMLDTYYIKELIKNENKTIFPTIKSTEKPDTIVKSLLKGKICVISENSNNVLIIPTFFLDFFYTDEDDYQKKPYAIFVKILRIIAFFTTIFLPSIYLSLITFDQQILPTDLLISFSIQKSSVPFPAIVEAIILILTFEILYEADAITPTSRGTSLSILGALVLGDAAVSAGIISPIMVIVIAMTAISSIFFVYYEFQSYIRIARYSLMILSSLFGIVGILFGYIFIVSNLCSINSFEKPFLFPLTPIIKKSKHFLINHGLAIQNTDKGDI